MVIFFTLLTLTQLALAGSEPPRVVAVGDLHGDLDNAIAVLKLADVVNEAGNWAAGNTILVQTGDTTDRGPDSRKLLDLMMRLETQAAAEGGQVHALLGNHEVMNLLGDWRYVDPGDIDQFGGPEARRAALSATGTYGAWLRTRKVAAQIDRTVFVHGGISPAYATGGVEAINGAAKAALSDQPGALMTEHGPLWYRGYVQDPEASACLTLKTALTALDADRMVVGHTTRRDGRVESRCDGALLVIDIGIADAYGSNLGCIEIVNGDARALYPSGSTDLADPSP